MTVCQARQSRLARIIWQFISKVWQKQTETAAIWFMREHDVQQGEAQKIETITFHSRSIALRPVPWAISARAVAAA